MGRQGHRWLHDLSLHRAETLPSFAHRYGDRRLPVAICSPWGCPVPEGETGELVIYGASVTQGYIDAPQQTAAAYLKDTNG